VTDCECSAGYTGDIQAPADTCSACEVGEYKDARGDEACTSCPDDSGTADAGSTSPGDCECNAGFAGTITDPDDTCDECDVGQYNGDVGSATVSSPSSIIIIVWFVR
jgi:hypothetical protein